MQILKTNICIHQKNIVSLQPQANHVGDLLIEALVTL